MFLAGYPGDDVDEYDCGAREDDEQAQDLNELHR